MSSFDILRFQFGNAPAEQRLANLRPEGLRLINPIKGYSELLVHELEKSIPQNVAPEIKDWSLIIRDKIKELEELFEAFTAPDYRERFGLPELKPYNTLLDAVKQTAVTLKLPIYQALVESELYIHSEYPLVIWDSPKPAHQIVWELVENQYRVQTYSIVSSESERLFTKDDEFWPSTLEEVATIIQHWYIDKENPEEKGQE